MLGLGVILGGCSSSGADYPVVEEPGPSRQVAWFQLAGGVRHPVYAQPRITRVAPSKSCERRRADGDDTLLSPPRPGLTARASGPGAHRVEVAWSFLSLPSDCRPEAIRILVYGTRCPVNGVAVPKVNAMRGTVTIRVPGGHAYRALAVADAGRGFVSRPASVAVTGGNSPPVPGRGDHRLPVIPVRHPDCQP